MSCLLSQRACAQLLGVCERTVRHWDQGRNRVPWSAVRLLRILRAGEIPARGFDGWRVLDGGRFVSPEGRVFEASGMAWWSLTCRMAQDWKRERGREAASRPSAGKSLPALASVPDGGAVDLAARSEPGAAAAAEGTSLGAASLPPAEPAFAATAARPVPQGRAAPAAPPREWPLGCADSSARASGCDVAGLGVPSASPPAPGAMPVQSQGRIVPSANRGLKGLKMPDWHQSGIENPISHGLHDAIVASCRHCHVQGAAHGVVHFCPIPGTPEGRSDGLRGALGDLPQRPVCGGAARLPRREEQAAGAGGGAGTTGCVCDCPGVDPGGGAEGRSESALPLRQRPEVQALSRQGLTGAGVGAASFAGEAVNDVPQLSGVEKGETVQGVVHE